MHPYTCYKTDHLQRSQNCIKKKNWKWEEKYSFVTVITLKELEKLITDFKHTFNVIIITVNGGELF